MQPLKILTSAHLTIVHVDYHDQSAKVRPSSRRNTPRAIHEHTSSRSVPACRSDSNEPVAAATTAAPNMSLGITPSTEVIDLTSTAASSSLADRYRTSFSPRHVSC